MDEAKTVGTTIKANKPNSIIADAHQELGKAHAVLQDELYGLADKIKDVTTPTEPSDNPSTNNAVPVTSTMASLLYEETRNVHRAIEFIRALKDRVEL